MAELHDAMWQRQRLKRSLNHAYVYALNGLHLLLDLSPWFLRNLAWRLLLRDCGSGVFFDHKIYVKYPRLVSIGHDVSINRGVEFYCSMRVRSRILIGSNVRIAPNVQLHAAGHDPADPQLGETGADIVVGDDAWIGAGAIVLQGVRIGHGAIIAAGSVVTADVADNVIAGGVPARTLRMRQPGAGSDARG